MEFKLLTSKLLEQYISVMQESPLDKLKKIKKPNLNVDHFQFYKSVSSVYSSKIEREEIEFDFEYIPIVGIFGKTFYLWLKKHRYY